MSNFSNLYFGRYFVDSAAQTAFSRQAGYLQITNLKYTSLDNVCFLIFPLFSASPSSFNFAQGSPECIFSFRYPSSGIALPIFCLYGSNRYHFSWSILLRDQNWSSDRKSNILAPNFKLTVFFLVCLRLKILFRLFIFESLAYKVY